MEKWDSGCTSGRAFKGKVTKRSTVLNYPLSNWFFFFFDVLNLLFKCSDCDISQMLLVLRARILRTT